jgi:hypothetical protein
MQTHKYIGNFPLMKRLAIVIAIPLMAWASEHTTTAHADDLAINVHATDADVVTSFEDDASLNLVAVTGGNVSRVKQHATDGDHALRVELNANPQGWPNIQLRLGGDAVPANWSAYVGIMFDMHFAKGPIQSCIVRVEAEHDGQTDKGTFRLSPTDESPDQFTLRFDRPKDMEAEALRLLNGIEGVKMPPSQQADLPHRENVTVFQIYVSRPQERCELYIDNIRLVRRFETDVPTENIIDPFGQLALLDWPGKVHSVDDMHALDRREQQWLDSAAPLEEQRDAYDGLIHPDHQYEATGFFRLQQVGDTWWMITPEGNLYFHNALCNIEPTAAPTLTTGREALYQWLPDKDDPLTAAVAHPVHGSNPGMMNFDIANLIRRYGDDYMAKWQQRALRRYQVWAFTGVHNWNRSPAWCDAQGKSLTPYSVTWYPQDAAPMLTQGVRGGIPDVFDPAYAADIDQHIRTQSQGLGDDPLLVGHFFGAEQDWVGLSRAFPRLPTDTACAKRLRQFLRIRYADSIEELRAAWGNPAATFDDLHPDDSAGPGMNRDMLAFLEIFADRFYRLCAEAIRRYNPNHLVLAERAHPTNFMDEVVRAMGRYCDAVSFDMYGDEPYAKCDRVYQLTGKPMLVSEMGFRARDRGLASSLYTVATQADRAEGYKRYMQAVLDKPYFVGSLLFCYKDQMFTAAPFGEAYNYGMVTIAETPHTEYVQAITEVNRGIYQHRLERMR